MWKVRSGRVSRRCWAYTRRRPSRARSWCNAAAGAPGPASCAGPRGPTGNLAGPMPSSLWISYVVQGALLHKATNDGNGPVTTLQNRARRVRGFREWLACSRAGEGDLTPRCVAVRRWRLAGCEPMAAGPTQRGRIIRGKCRAPWMTRLNSTCRGCRRKKSGNGRTAQERGRTEPRRGVENLSPHKKTRHNDSADQQQAGQNNPKCFKVCPSRRVLSTRIR